MSAIGSILSNDGALKALNSLRTSSNQTNNLETQLSSGKKINSPADNPAGYITAQGFTSQLNGINQATSNANQGVSLLQTAQGAINQQTSIVQKLNSIAVQASNGTQTPAEAQSLQNVVGQLNSQVNTIANQTQFNNINLLNGNFSGVDFQVGANNGQTISLSIGNTQASNLGMYASQGSSGGAVYSSSGAAKSVVTNGAGAFTAGSFAINGSNGTGSVNVSGSSESAFSIANSINQKTDTTNVQAQATTVATFSTSGSNFNFTLGNGNSGSATNTVNITATSQAGLISAINDHSAATGITAKNVNGNVQLTQSQGKNISFTNITSGSLTSTAGSGTVVSSGNATTVQGKVQLQSDKAFNLGSNATNIGLGSSTSLHQLSNIDVSTTSGAQSAINVIKYALQGLGAEGGKLGAVQQRLTANINNLNTTSQNLNSAKSVVQDANIPQVSQQLTQQQVLQQAGISALKNSSTLQQQYQRILP
ncbi:flagellin N-terminal helical domain-containing protein [Salinisphaera sp. SWV1]|uniref:flagellin N-terminal helical domain-containing protein n=1 Tax=Salinisphaera sp. SWV1 TaxID=3454139 RepID=UPI003F83892B